MDATKQSWLEQQNQEREDYKNEGKYKRRITFKSVICSKTVKGWIFLTIFACAAPVLMYYFIIDRGTYKSDQLFTCSIKTTFRVPCGKINISITDCEKLHCCYELSSQSCYHYLPSKYAYDLDKETDEYVTTQNKTPYGNESIRSLRISINEIDQNRVSIILHESDADIETNTTNDEKKYKVKLIEEKLMVEVYRSDTKDLLLSTAKGPLIASDEFWEWSIYISNHTLFGLNKTIISLEENSTFTKVIYKNRNDHYTLPVFWAYQNDRFHGVVIKHDGPIELTVLSSNMVLLKGLAAGKIELELSVGPTPRLLHDQQATVRNPPPYWTLDTYTCRKGDNINLTQLIQQYNLDNQTTSDCIHENLLVGIMRDNGTNTGVVKDILKQLKDQGIKFLLSVPPHIFGNTSNLYKKAVDLNLLYQYNQSVYKGKYFREDVVYPDYSHIDIQSYMEAFNELLLQYMDIDDIDGFVLHENWPENNNYRISNTSFPYLSEDLQEAMSNTLPWNTTTDNGATFHVRKHNSYGTDQLESMRTYYAKRKPDAFMMSASQLFGKIQPPLIQNINASWTNLRDHIDNVLFNSIVGNHLVNIPVCGDTNVYNGSLQETLCIRWYLVSATMPMFRIGSNEPWRDPTNLNTVFASNSAQRSIRIRKMLLPYYYTILSRNEPIVRPMFYDFYENTTTFSLRRQYMIGEKVLVAHPLTSGRNRLQIYLPSRIGIWYEFLGGQVYNSTGNPSTDVDVVETDFLAFISQGTVLPLKVDDVLNLIIALNCSSGSCTATGDLYEDSSYINFSADDTGVTVSDIPKGNCSLILEDITLYYYVNNTGMVKYYSNQDDLCTGEASVTVKYQNQNETLYTNMFKF